MKTVLAWIGGAVVMMALLGQIEPIQFRLYFGTDFQYFCETHQ